MLGVLMVVLARGVRRAGLVAAALVEQVHEELPDAAAPALEPALSPAVEPDLEPALEPALAAVHVDRAA